MLFVICIFIFNFFIKINLAGLYFAIQTCVFNPLETFQASSQIKCAVKCESTECKVFQFNATTNNCKLYGFHEICQINSTCRKETVFVNNKYNNMVTYIDYNHIDLFI